MRSTVLLGELDDEGESGFILLSVSLFILIISCGIINMHSKYSRLLRLLEASVVTGKKLDQAIYETVGAGLSAFGNLTHKSGLGGGCRYGSFSKPCCSELVSKKPGSRKLYSTNLGLKDLDISKLEYSKLGAIRLGSGVGYISDDFIGYWDLRCLTSKLIKLGIKVYKINGLGLKSLRLSRDYLI